MKQALLFRHKDYQLQVDLGDLQGEKEKLADFLSSRFKINATATGEGLKVNHEDASLKELKKAVNKFIYHRNLNGTHYVSLETNIVKINRFKSSKKKSEPRKQKKNQQQHATITQSWGLG